MNKITAKTGDAVFVANKWNAFLGRVVRITPTGRIVVSIGNGQTQTFHPDGGEMNKDIWGAFRIEAVGEEAIARMKEEKRKRIPLILNDFDFYTIPLELCVKIKEMIDAEKKT